MKRWLPAVVAAVVAALLASPTLAQGSEVTVEFELVVEGTPPEDATFFAQYLADGATVRLADQDGDGVYTGSMSGGPPDAGFRIVQGTGVERAMTGEYPRRPLKIIERFPVPDATEGVITLSSSTSFEVTSGENAGETVSATGIVEKPQMTTYMYGTHAVTDESSGTAYALSSEVVDLDELAGKRATVTGTLVPGYQDGQVEGGPPLLEVKTVEPIGGGGREIAIGFEVTVAGEVPEGASIRVQSEAVPEGTICDGEGGPACRGAGETETLEVAMPLGERFEYRILAGRGDGSPEAVVAEGSEVAEDGLVVRATYEFTASNEDDPGQEDVNGDGIVDDDDGSHAARISDDAKSAVDPARNPLPVTGGAALLVLAAGAMLAAAGYFVRRAMR